MVSKAATRAPLGGVHHVTALAGDPAKTIAFYAGPLALRCVKRTVNFDDPTTWHLYFGDAVGSPGSLLTFFPVAHAARGRRGAGEVASVALAVPTGSLGFWRARLNSAGVAVHDRTPFGEPALAFEDPDGLALELVERPVEGAPHLRGGVGAEHAIRGVEGVALTLGEIGATEALLAGRLSYLRADVETEPEGERVRLAHASGGLGAHVDLLARPKLGQARSGAGSVHHVAFRAADEAAQVKAAAVIAEDGLGVTPVRNRNYFRSIYFREPGGVLFEVATDGPGFMVDETAETLGSALKLPDWLEPRRTDILRGLPPLEAPAKRAG